jgi:hypothetical protein
MRQRPHVSPDIVRDAPKNRVFDRSEDALPTRAKHAGRLLPALAGHRAASLF